MARRNSNAAPKAKPAAPKTQPSIFEQAVTFVLADQIEGGYVNDPRDPGGETNYGISKRSYPKVDIKNLTREDAIAIYKRDFWDKCRCDELPPEIAVAVFDCAVNQGASIAPRLLQKALRVSVDGEIGPETLGAARKADVAEAVLDLLSWRLRRYAFTGNASTYMRGWSKRVLHLLTFLLTEIEVA